MPGASDQEDSILYAIGALDDALRLIYYSPRDPQNIALAGKARKHLREVCAAYSGVHPITITAADGIPEAVAES